MEIEKEELTENEKECSLDISSMGIIDVAMGKNINGSEG